MIARHEIKSSLNHNPTFTPTSNSPLSLPTLQDAPPPGSYDVIKSYDRSQVKPPVAKPRTEAAHRKHGSFMSAASRYDTQPSLPGPNPKPPPSYSATPYSFTSERLLFGLLYFLLSNVPIQETMQCFRRPNFSCKIKCCPIGV